MKKGKLKMCKIKNVQNDLEIGNFQLNHFNSNNVVFSKLSSCDI